MPGSTAVPKDDARIIAWAAEVSHVEWGTELGERWKEPSRALGEAEGTSTDVVPLGNRGSLTLVFAQPIADGPGFDLAVFENGITDGFLELAFVEVSSDGETFVRFPCVYLGTEPVAAFANLDPTTFEGLAGRYRAGFGTPFDLGWLRDEAAVEARAVDLKAIRYVRIVDVLGDGSERDSAGHLIYDPYPTRDSAGFDLDAVAVLRVP
jgi:hypothetical protein